MSKFYDPEGSSSTSGSGDFPLTTRRERRGRMKSADVTSISRSIRGVATPQVVGEAEGVTAGYSRGEGRQFHMGKIIDSDDRYVRSQAARYTRAQPPLHIQDTRSRVNGRFARVCARARTHARARLARIHAREIDKRPAARRRCVGFDDDIDFLAQSFDLLLQLVETRRPLSRNSNGRRRAKKERDREHVVFV